MKFKQLLSMVFVAGFILTGCQSASSQVEETQISETEDVSGASQTESNETADDATVEDVKIVSSTVSATQVLAKLNAELLGVPTTSQTLPEVYADLPQVGQAMNPDLEIVASLEPDLLVMDASFKANVEESLSSYGLNTFFFETGSYASFINSIEQLGKEIHRELEAEALVNEIKEAKEAALAIKGETSPTVAVIFGAGDNFMLATDSSYLGDLVTTVGATNISSELEGDMSSGYVQFSLEQILAQNPDYILRFAHGNIEETTKMFNEAFEKNEVYQELDAVKNGKVYDLDSSIFNVSANLEIKTAITTLGEILYGK